MPLDAKHLSGELAEQRRHVTGARADLENTVRFPDLQCFQHRSHDVRLRDGLPVSDGQRHVRICINPQRLWNELVARNWFHRLQHTLVSYAPAMKLQLDHGNPLIGKGVLHELLPLALLPLYVEAHHSVLVTNCHDGEIAVDVELRLDDLLRRLRGIGDVGERHLIGNLLLDGDAEAAAVRDAEILLLAVGIDFDAAHAEQLLHPAAQGGIQRPAEDRIRRVGVNNRLLIGLLQHSFFACASESKQRDDVGGRQRRIGAVRHGEFIDRPMEADGDVVIADARRRFQIEYRLDTDRIRKENVAAIECVLRPVQEDVAFNDVDAPQNDGLRDGAAESKISVPGNLGQRSLHLQLGCGDNVHVEVNIVEWRSRLWDRRRLVAAGKVLRKIKTRIQSEAVDGDVAGKRRILCSANELEISIGDRAHTRRITQADVAAIRGQCEIRIALDGDVSAEVQGSTTGPRGQLLYLQTVLIKVESAIDLAQSVGKIDERDAGIVDLDLAIDVGFVDGAADVHGGIGEPIRNHIAIEILQQLKVHLPVCAEMQAPFADQIHRARCGKIGSITHDVQTLDFHHLIRVSETHRAVVIQLQVLDFELYLRKVAVRGQKPRLAHRPFE